MEYIFELADEFLHSLWSRPLFVYLIQTLSDYYRKLFLLFEDVFRGHVEEYESRILRVSGKDRENLPFVRDLNFIGIAV